MKINIKEFVHNINRNIPEQYRNIAWTIIILGILILINWLIQKVM